MENWLATIDMGASAFPRIVIASLLFWGSVSLLYGLDKIPAMNLSPDSTIVGTIVIVFALLVALVSAGLVYYLPIAIYFLIKEPGVRTYNAFLAVFLGLLTLCSIALWMLFFY